MPTRLSFGKTTPLRHELRADDDVDPAFRDLLQLVAHPLDRRNEIA